MKYREIRFPCDFSTVFVLGERADERLADRVGDRSVRALVQNVSTRGARIQTDFALRIGDQIVLSLPGGPQRATVRWVGDVLAGVRFDRALPAQTISAMRGSHGSRLARSGWNLHLREFG